MERATCEPARTFASLPQPVDLLKIALLQPIPSAKVSTAAAK
jgi:hypothetical protein